MSDTEPDNGHATSFERIVRSEFLLHQPAIGSINQRFCRIVRRSGSDQTVQNWVSICMGCGVGGFVAAFLLTGHPIAAAIGLTTGVTLPILWLTVAGRLRATRIKRQIPLVCESIAGNLRASATATEALHLAGINIPEPIASEVGQVITRTRLGQSPPRAFIEVSEECDVVEFRMMAMAFELHQNLGSRLASGLESYGLSERERWETTDRMRASMVAGRMATSLMVLVPLAILGFYFLRDPSYLNRLLNSHYGRRSLQLAIILQFLGLISVRRILNSVSSAR